MRDLMFCNYPRMGENTTCSNADIRDVAMLAALPDEELAPMITEDETCNSVRERCQIELLIRAMGDTL